MATFIFDGTTSITAAKTDTVVISANPALFVSAADNLTGGSVFTYSGGATLTITGTNFGPNATSFPNVSLANGTFSTSATASSTPMTANDLVFAPTGAGVNTDVSGGGTAAGIKAVFGGLGIADPADGADSISVGGKGSLLVYGNAGADSITETVAFDSSSFATVFGGKGDDSILLNVPGNTGAHMAIYGSEGNDTISVVNTGASSATTIFGGVGAADSADGNDSISFTGGGTVTIYANAGNDTVNLMGGLDSTANVTVHGGLGTDTINITSGAVKNTVVVYGDEGADSIGFTTGTGTNTVYLDTGAADTAGGADSLNILTAGTTTVYAAAGNDTVMLNGVAGGSSSTDVLSVFGGNGNDSINVTGYTQAAGSITLTLGAGADTVNVAYAGVTGSQTSIADYVPTSGGDKLIITTGTVQAQATTITGTFQTMQQALDAAAQGANKSIAAVVYNGSTYVVVNDGVAGFSSTTDLAIKLTGVTDLASVVTSVSSV